MRFLLAVLFFNINLFAQIGFDNFFENKTLRIDYFHTGSIEEEFYSIDELKEEPYWGGSKVNLIDKFEYGKYKIEVYDSTSDKLIYSRGYSTLFSEWLTTKEAVTTTKSFSETVVIPFPKNSVRVEFYSRNKKNKFKKKFVYNINPENYFISPEMKKVLPVFDVHISGAPSKKVDIVIIPDGYRKDDLDSFKLDCKKFSDYLFDASPYKENKDKFNVRGVLAVSEDSGTDIPAKNIWRKTILNTSYYTFDLERYLMTSDNKSVRDVAGNAPYDQIYILVKSKGYGGGAIYNHYSVCVNNNVFEDYIFTHEFGHGFAGLADEYYTSDVAYEEFYPLNVEPWEPNLTTRIDFDKKWEKLVGNNIPVPTPEIEQYDGVVGLFEGGGYVPEGIYRPMMDCTMKSITIDNFCVVCKKAILDMIDFYSN